MTALEDKSRAEHSGADVIDFAAAKEAARAKDAPKKEQPQVQEMHVDRGNVREARVALVDEHGTRIGQAEVGETMVSKNMLEPQKADVHAGDSEMGHMLENSESPAETERIIEQELEEEHIENIVNLLILLYTERVGAQVYKAKKVTFDTGMTSLADTEGTTSGRTEYEYIIPRSGADAMKDLVHGELPAYLTRGGYQFDCDPSFGDVMGDRGFTVTLNLGDAVGNKKAIDINFFYGSDGTVAEEEQYADVA